MSSDNEKPDTTDLYKARARIAELEAEVAARDMLRSTNDILANGMRLAEARIAELEAELEVAKGLDRSRSVEAQKIGGEFVRLQAARIAELEAECGTLQAQRDMAIIDASIDLMAIQAERDRLKAALEPFVGVRFGEHIPLAWFDRARAALSGEKEKT